ARIADVDGTLRLPAAEVVHGDASRIHELARPRARNARLAVIPLRADLALLLAVPDAPSPGTNELSVFVELLDARISGIGDVEPSAALIDRHPARELEQAGARAAAAERTYRDQQRRLCCGYPRRRERADCQGDPSDTRAREAKPERATCSERGVRCALGLIRNTRNSHRLSPLSAMAGRWSGSRLTCQFRFPSWQLSRTISDELPGPISQLPPFGMRNKGESPENGRS